MAKKRRDFMVKDWNGFSGIVQVCGFSLCAPLCPHVFSPGPQLFL